MHYNMELRSNEHQDSILENRKTDYVLKPNEPSHNTQGALDILISHQEYLHIDDGISANIRSLQLKIKS